MYEAIGQGHAEVMTACDISFHGDTLMCQIRYDYVKGPKSWGPNTKSCQKKTLKSKVNIVLESWMFATHPLMTINLCAKYGRPLYKQKSFWPDTDRNLPKQTDRQTERQ